MKKSIIFFVPGQQVPAYQDLGRLLLLRERAAGPVRGPRKEHRRDGAGHDRRDIVSAERISRPGNGKVACSCSCLKENSAHSGVSAHARRHQKGASFKDPTRAVPNATAHSCFSGIKIRESRCRYAPKPTCLPSPFL